MPEAGRASEAGGRADGRKRPWKPEPLSNFHREWYTRGEGQAACLKGLGLARRPGTAGEAVVLGCTELPLLLHAGSCPLSCLDSVDIHLGELMRLAMQ